MALKSIKKKIYGKLVYNKPLGFNESQFYYEVYIKHMMCKECGELARPGQMYATFKNDEGVIADHSNKPGFCKWCVNKRHDWVMEGIEAYKRAAREIKLNKICELV